MLIEHGDARKNLEAMLKRGNCNRFTMDRREQNSLNSAPFVAKTVKAICGSDCPETLIVFENSSHRMDMYVSTITRAIVQKVDPDHAILAVCVETEEFNQLKGNHTETGVEYGKDT